MDSTSSSDLIDIDIGGGDPVDDTESSPVVDALDEIAANQAATRRAIEQLAEQQGADIDTNDQSTYPYTLRATVPPLTSPVDPLTASFETPYPGTITLAIPRFPNVLSTTGIALYGPQESKLLPRGGEYNYADDDGGRDTGEVKYLTGNNTTYPPVALNVDADEGQTIEAQFSNTDPEYEHLVSIDVYYREREV